MGWNIFYTLLSLLICFKNGIEVEPLPEIAIKFLSFKYNGYMWFFVPLLTLYLTMPFLACFVLNARRERLKMFLLISLLIGCLAPLSSDFSVRSNTQDIYLFGTRFLVYAVAGFYFGTYDISYRMRRKLYSFAVLSIAIMIIGTAFLHFNYPNHYKYFIQYTNIPCTVLAYAVFVFFRYTDWSLTLSKFNIRPVFLATMSSLSLGVYLIQLLAFWVIGYINPFKDQMFVLFVEMYLSSLCIVYLMKRIPLIKKFV